MAHDLEISIDGFEQAFASRSQPAWHGLGTVSLLAVQWLAQLMAQMV